MREAETQQPTAVAAPESVRTAFVQACQYVRYYSTLFFASAIFLGVLTLVLAALVLAVPGLPAQSVTLIRAVGIVTTIFFSTGAVQIGGFYDHFWGQMHTLAAGLGLPEYSKPPASGVLRAFGLAFGLGLSTFFVAFWVLLEVPIR